MNSGLFIGLILLPLLGLACLLWWRFRGSGKGKEVVSVADRNHRSLKRYHYGPGPAPPETASTAGPALTNRPPSSQLPPTENLRTSAEQKLPLPQSAIQAVRSSAAGTAKSSQEVIEVPSAVADKKLTAVPQPSSRPASKTTGSVLDVLGVDAPAAPAAAQLPAPVANATPPFVAAPDDEPIAESLFDNPLTAATPTQNDEANRLIARELRRQNRAALQAATAGQQAALTSLLAENNPPR